MSPARAIRQLSDDDRPFIVLTETKLSKRHIPVWARYSPLLAVAPRSNDERVAWCGLDHNHKDFV